MSRYIAALRDAVLANPDGADEDFLHLLDLVGTGPDRPDDPSADRSAKSPTAAAASPAVDQQTRDWCLTHLFSGVTLSPEERMRLACEAGDPSLATQVRPLDPANVVTRSFLQTIGELIAGGADPAHVARCHSHPEIPLVLGVAEPADEPQPAGAGKGKRSKAEQSRVNGAKSRGPRTDDGRIAACRNSLRHGMRARLGLLPDEEPEAYRAFCDEVRDDMSPANRLQRELTQRIADIAWRLRRMQRLEARALATDPATGVSRMADYPQEAVDRMRQLIGDDEADGELMRLQRYAGQLERSMRNALREYQQLQAIESKRPAACDRPATAPVGAAAVIAPASATAPTASPPDPLTVAPPPAPSTAGQVSDGLRFSGSFGATATLAMPTTAFTPAAPVSADAAVSAISGSFGQKRRAAGKSVTKIATSNEILPSLAAAATPAAVS